ncbi:hypothetical protein TRIUR3_33548 [Triticum urartu]|uniref:Uncharacterized protein n=1 Tax=Triticum urartu TaxID=4572 RepID=M7YMV0_TRIUA|nr:hypothetical protein TRIUR3_33548 [Triticum urartu]
MAVAFSEPRFYKFRLTSTTDPGEGQVEKKKDGAGEGEEVPPLPLVAQAPATTGQLFVCPWPGCHEITENASDACIRTHRKAHREADTAEKNKPKQRAEDRAKGEQARRRREARAQAKVKDKDLNPGKRGKGGKGGRNGKCFHSRGQSQQSNWIMQEECSVSTRELTTVKFQLMTQMLVAGSMTEISFAARLCFSISSMVLASFCQVPARC